MNVRDHGSYIEDIIEHMNKTVLSVTKCIEVVGEATKHIPDSIREKYPDIPWNDLAGVRDRLVGSSLFQAAISFWFHSPKIFFARPL
jgi:uncharacterized protein with HEPN domain